MDSTLPWRWSTCTGRLSTRDGTLVLSELSVFNTSIDEGYATSLLLGTMRQMHSRAEGELPRTSRYVPFGYLLGKDDR